MSGLQHDALRSVGVALPALECVPEVLGIGHEAHDHTVEQE